MDWGDRSASTFQRQSRDQRTLDLIEADAAPPARSARCSPRPAKTWVTLHNNLRFLDDGGFLWSSERSGFEHLYLLRRATASCTRSSPRASGWSTSCSAVDEAAGLAYFSAHARIRRSRRHVYARAAGRRRDRRA